MSRNTAAVGGGGRNTLYKERSVSFDRASVDTGSDGELTITIDGLRDVARATIEAEAGGNKAVAVPQSGDDLLVVILNDADNTPVANTNDVTDISGVAYGD